MTLITIGFLSFWILIVVFELCTLIGWSADRMLVERAKSPGPYWVAIALHIVICIGLPAVYLFAG